MEVHVGKCSSETFECDICDEKFDKTHLNTCEVHKCALVRCLIRLQTLSEMKKYRNAEYKTLLFY